MLAIVDVPPVLPWLWPWAPAGGFKLVQVIDDWPGRGPLKSDCAIFRKPEADP